MSKKIKPLISDTYLAVIKNSIGSKMFRNSYVKIDGKKIDILKNGDVSCAFYVSSILMMFKLVGNVHATVDGTVKDLEKSSWKKINKPKIGYVLVWEETDFGKNDLHKHIGFYIGNNKAISNSTKKRFPAEHDWKFDGKRKIELMLWNKNLDK